MRRMFILMFAISVLLCACKSNNPAESIQENIADASSSMESEYGNAEEMKRRFLTEHTLETNDEVCDMLIYLLEHGSELTREEKAQMEATFVDDYANVWLVYHWYRENALDTIKLRVMEKKLLLPDRSTGGKYDEFAGGADFLLKVEVQDSGGSDIPLGVQEWVFQTIWPMYGFVALSPDELITLEEYELRMECHKYQDSVELVQQLMEWGIGQPFDRFADIPNDNQVHYVVHRMAQEYGFEKDTFTQAELDAAALRFCGIAHLEPGDSPLYDAQTGLYTAHGYALPIRIIISAV